MGLKVYTVHIRQKPLKNGDPDIVLVPEGFSVWAFLFQFVWALFHRLWLVAVIMLLISGMMEWAFRFAVGDVTALACQLGLGILIGAEAQNLRRWTLQRRGYRLDAVVIGETLDEAELRYFEQNPEKMTAHASADPWSDFAPEPGRKPA